MKTYFFLILIVVFSFVFRTWHLDVNPTGFFCDEASTGIDAFSILKTGYDRNGDFLPLFFKGFNFDNVSPFQVYFTIPFVGLFGLSEMSVRLTSVFWSVIELIIFFFLLKEFVSSKLALLGTIIFSLSPWHFHMSRINMGDYYVWTLFTTAATLFLIKGIKKSNAKFLIIYSILMGFITYGYTPARLITPLLFIASMSLFLSRKLYKHIFLMAGIYFIVIIPFLYFHLTDRHSFQRIKYTMGIDLKGEEKALNSERTKNLPAIFMMKYISHYSDAFLFTKGDADYPGQFIRRHSISGLGLLYPYQRILLILGVCFLLYNVWKRKREYFFILFLLVLFPVADSLASDMLTPFATRSYVGVIPMQILIILGIYLIFRIIDRTIKDINSKKKAVVLSTIILIIFIFHSFTQLVYHFERNPLTTSDFWGWQYGPKKIMAYFLENSDKYDEMFMSGEFNAGEIFLSFYDPEGTCREKCKMGQLRDAPELYDPVKRQLFSMSPDYLAHSKFKDNFTLKHTVYYPDGKVAFFIGEVKKGTPPEML